MLKILGLAELLLVLDRNVPHGTGSPATHFQEEWSR